MSSQIKVKKNTSLKDIEVLFRTTKDSNITDMDFIVPSSLKIDGFGALPSFFSLFFFWLREKKGAFIIECEKDEKEELSLFTLNYVGYVLIVSAWKHRPILNKNREEIRLQLRPDVQKFHDRLDFLQQLPNDNILIPLFDHYSKQRGLSHWLYSQDFQLYTTPEGLDNSIYRIFKEFSKIYRTRVNANSQAIFEDLQVIIWELVSNTHFHATKDYLNKTELSPSTRGVYFKIHRSSKKNFLQENKDYIGLNAYYQNTLSAEKDNFVLEISVFDSGPGLAKRFLGSKWTDSLSLTDEVAIIKSCLVKGVTSTVGVSGMARGFGLNNVLNTLSKKNGFIKIRSGRASLYRDLLKSPHLDVVDATQIELCDWLTGSNANFTDMGAVCGTLITMSYPLIYAE
jgi:hypothetical protein